MRNMTIRPQPVVADWHKLPTKELIDVPRQIARVGAYNRDTILELTVALASRVEELERVLASYRGAP